MHCFSVVQSFWPVQINQPLIDAIKKLSSRSKELPITTYEFSTLYTNIRDNKLKYLMKRADEFVFQYKLLIKLPWN